MLNAQKDSKNGSKFAGVDVDWEPNGNNWTLPVASGDTQHISVSKEDLNNYKEFLIQLKSRLEAETQVGNLSDSKLRIAIAANPTVLVHVNKTYGASYWQELLNIVTTIDPMTYDYHGSFDGSGKKTGFNSPLWNDKRAESAGYDMKLSVQGTTEALVAAGIAPGKIIIGIPTYGRGYKINEAPSASNPYVTFSDSLNVPGSENGSITNRTILTGYYTQGEERTSINYNFLTNLTQDYIAGQTYSWGWGGPNYDTQGFITFDNATSAKNKMTFVKDKGLAGTMVWSLDGDIRPGDFGADGKPLDYNEYSVIFGLNLGR